MKTVLVLSDTHGNLTAVESLYSLVSESNYVVHLGDGYRDMKPFYADFGDKIYQVDGNCDFTGLGLKYFVLEVEGVNILLTHGDSFSVKTGLSRLIEFAKSKNCKVALYGHTHEPKILEVDGVLTVNPGSLSYFTPFKSVAYLVINGDKVVAKLNYNAVKN
jgi:putative phosphoesterase